MKISSGKFKGIPLYCPDSRVRPTLIKIRQAIFNILRPMINNSVFIDLFAGTGAFGFEAISNGAAKVYFIDKDNFKFLKKNVEKLKLEKSLYEIISTDYRSAIKLLGSNKTKADIIFADPPYNKRYVEELLKNVIIREIININGLFVIEVHKNERKETEQFLKYWLIEKEKKYGDIHILFLIPERNSNARQKFIF